MANVYELIDVFPHPVLPKITGKPTYEQVKELHRKLNANAVSVETTLGGRKHGYLGITLMPAAYQVLTGNVFVPPQNP